MNIKSLYKKYYGFVDTKGERLEKTKTRTAELFSVVRRQKMYKSIEWTFKQQQEFDYFWKQNYGKTISNKWHKIYESINGQHCVEYIPEILYTTQIEYLLNDYNYSKVFEDKSLIETISRGACCCVPETLIVCSKGIYFDNKRNVVSFSGACRLIENYKNDIVIKPTINTGSGKNIHFVNGGDLEKVKLLLKGMGNDFIVQAAIIPDPVFASLNPASINTLRVTTYILNNNIYHMPIACRMGGGDSKLDNIHAGGIGIGVLDDGRMMEEGYLLGYGDNNKKYYEHPYTKVVFSDIVLPSVNKVIEAAYEVHVRLPHIGIISWDFTVNRDGDPVLIEANLRNQGIWFPQIIHGKGAFEDNTEKILKLLRELRGNRLI